MWFFMPEELQDLFSAHRQEQWLDWNGVEPMKYSLDQFSSWDSGCLELLSRPHAHVHVSLSYSGDGQKCVSLLELGAGEPVPCTSCPFMLTRTLAACWIRDLYCLEDLAPPGFSCHPTETWAYLEFYLPKQSAQLKPGPHNHWASGMSRGNMENLQTADSISWERA